VQDPFEQIGITALETLTKKLPSRRRR
jgi:hypothetical protein